MDNIAQDVEMTASEPLTPTPNDSNGVDMDADTNGHREEIPEVLRVEDKFEQIIKDAGQGLEAIDKQVYTWHVPSWTELRKSEKFHTHPFECGGYKWRLLIFPNGNHHNRDKLSIYLDVAEKPETEGWGICAEFVITVANPTDTTAHHAQYSHHRFDSIEPDWGFGSFYPISKLPVPTPATQNKPLLENDQLILLVYVRVVKDETGILWHSFRDYDSKKVTGYVGLKNQGATCYMNSLLQSLFCTNYVRKMVYQVPTEDDDPTKSVGFALQRLFYALQTSDQAAGTQELTKSFGWDTLDAFMQHDVQEFNRVLQDSLENKMKGTPADGAIQRTFVGKMKSYIKCINVDFESSRIENFYDIQLNVKSCKTLRDSFVDYCTVETLDGDNKYMAEGYGLQDAKKGVIFESFPPVLHLQLKRFEYDMHKDAMVKINDRHEFPERIDLTEFLPEDADKSVPQVFQLHGVLVHSGDLHGGHYCAFIKPTIDGKWLKFDDDRVTPASIKEVFNDNFGGDLIGINGAMTPPTKSLSRYAKRFTNAYMLVYIRVSDLDTILAPVTEEDIPPHIPKRIMEEQRAREERAREERERHLYITLKLIDDEHIQNHDSLDLANFDREEFELTPLLYTDKVMKAQVTWGEFKNKFAQETAIDLANVRFWALTQRTNKTSRPDTIITNADDQLSIEKLKDKVGAMSGGRSDFRIYVERESEPFNEKYFFPPTAPEIPNGLALVFLKHYDILNQKMTIVGHTHVNRNTSMKDFAPFILKLMNWPPNTPIKLWEEIRSTMIDPITIKKTWIDNEIGTGDIIVFHRELSKQELDTLPMGALKSVPDYYDFINHRVLVIFRPRTMTDTHISRDKPQDSKDDPQLSGEFSIIFSRKTNYDNLASQVAERLSCDPMKLRFSTKPSVSATNLALSNLHIVKRGSNPTLNEMLGSYASIGNTGPPTLYWEILDHSVIELENNRVLRVTFLNQNLKEDGTFELLIPKTVTIQVLFEQLSSKITLSGRGSNKIRIWDVMKHQIHRDLQPTDLVSSIQEYQTLYCEEIPMEELHMTEGDQIIHVMHFNRAFVHAHGIPFKFVIKNGELFSEAKKRLQGRLNLKDKDFEKIKCCLVDMTKFKPEEQYKYLEDDDIISEYKVNSPDLVLGLDHPDKRPKTFLEKALKIYS